MSSQPVTRRSKPVKTQLKHGVLWHDGILEVDPAEIAGLLLQGVPLSRLSVTSITSEIEKLNEELEHPLTIKTSLNAISTAWVLPANYKYFDVDEYLVGLSALIERDELYQERQQRLAKEIVLFKHHKLDDVVRVLVYVVDTFKKDDVVWGVGRGSSCSSYILYLLGLHEVDPVRYNINIEDFIR